MLSFSLTDFVTKGLAIVQLAYFPEPLARSTTLNTAVYLALAVV